MLSQEENRGKLALFAGIDDVRFKRIVEPGDELISSASSSACAARSAAARRARRVGRQARRPRHADLRGGAVIGDRRPSGRVSITGLGCTSRTRSSRTTTSRRSSTPPTSGSVERTGIRERRVAARRRGALRPLRSRPRAGARRGRRRRDGRSTCHRRDRHAGHDLPVARRRSSPTASAPPNAAAYDLSAGCTGLHLRARPGGRRCSPPASRSARSSSAATPLQDRRLDRPLDLRPLRRRCGRRRPRARSTRAASSASSSARTAAEDGTSSSRPAARGIVEEANGKPFVRMNGREVFRFATRVLVRSREGPARRDRPHGRRRRRLHSPPGEPENHQARRTETRHLRGAHRHQRRPLRQHLVRLDPARTGGGDRGRPREGGRPRAR